MSENETGEPVTCPDCGERGIPGEDAVVPVWQEKEAFGRMWPDFMGCTACGTMRPTEEWLS